VSFDVEFFEVRGCIGGKRKFVDNESMVDVTCEGVDQSEVTGSSSIEMGVGLPPTEHRSVPQGDHCSNSTHTAW
jgi:hypothetical protein